MPHRADSNVCYSLPHIITTPIQCSFGTYFWEMYITEFGWTKSEYGIVSWTYNIIQIISHLGLGGLFILIDKDNNNAQWWTKGIEAVAIFIHALTYFLLIYLPIKWHDVKTPYVDSLFGKTSNFRQAMFGRSVPLSSMATSRGWYRFFCIPWAFVKFFWIILYLPMKIFYLIVVNFGAILWTLSSPLKFCRRSQPRIEEVLPVLETLPTHKPSNFAMRMRHARQFMGTKTFGVYMLAIVHGVGISMFELCNKALPNYIYGGYVSSQTQPRDAERGMAITVNVSFFTTVNFFIILIFSLVKFYARSGAKFAETFLLISILFLFLNIPILPALICTPEESPHKSQSGNLDVKEWLVLAGLTCFHATTFFWIFTGGPLTFYVSSNILNWHSGIMSFGVFTILIGFAGAQIVNLIVVDKTITWTHAAATDKDRVHRIVVGACIPCQLFTFMLLYPHDWWWNKNHWFNYVLLVATGVVNTIFVAYIYIMMTQLAGSQNVKEWKWFFYGVLYAVTGLVVSFSMRFMFRSMDHDEPWISIPCKCVKINLRYNFRTIYGGITLFFIFANIIGALPIWIQQGYPSLT